MTYKQAGVDLDLYQQAMRSLPGLMRSTHSSRVIDLTGGFAGLFRLNDADNRYRDPVLVSGTDGVGTKIKVATRAKRYGTIGIDLVAMCVNDCLCLGAEPLFFLDYLALGRDDPQLIEQLVSGVTEGCRQADTSLLGGETAIMPDLYAAGDFDLAGFCVGVVERDRLIDGTTIRPGDVLIGLSSSGFHSNGYSLLRKVVFEREGLDVADRIESLGRSVADVLLEPTAIYARTVSAVIDRAAEESPIHGMAHITGGGLAENIERILPEGCRAQIDGSGYPLPDVYAWLLSLGHVSRDEADRVFNMGIGFVIVAEASAADSIRQRLSDLPVTSWIIGEVRAGTTGVERNE